MIALNSDSVLVKKKFTPKVDEMSFILRTKTTSVSIPFTDPTSLWKHPQFNSSKPLVIFVTGWKTDLKNKASQAQDVMADAYLCRGDWNFVVNTLTVFFISCEPIFEPQFKLMYSLFFSFFLHQSIDTGLISMLMNYISQFKMK